MKKYLATLQKELIQLFRDRAGMAILFIMPMALILIMVAVQDVPFSDFQEKKIPILIYDADGDSLGAVITRGIQQNPVFELTIRKVKKLDRLEIQKEVNDGAFKVGIGIPEKSTYYLREQLRGYIAKALNGEEPKPDYSSQGNGSVDIFFDPVIKQSFRTTVINNLEKHLSRVEMKTMLELFQVELRELLPDMNSLDLSSDPMITLIERSENQATVQGGEAFNAAQHNVPAYTVFGIFFIVITMAANHIRERDDGSDLRLRLIPGSFWPARTGRITAYLIITILQAFLMLSVGLTILPWMGYPALYLGSETLALIAVIAATGLAACGYGMTVGTLFSTHQQAAVFGAVSVVIMSALGGVWVPIFVMPAFIQKISQLIPVGWSLDSFNELFLRGGGMAEVSGNILLLILFFVANMIISQLVENYRNARR